jgi:hypothetical protein
MFQRFRLYELPVLSLLGLLAFSGYICFAPVRSASAEPRQGQQRADAASEEKPVFTNFKGVELGMAAADARQKLGVPSDKGDEQDFFALSDKNTAQVFYDREKKVYAISVNYLGGENIPTPQSVVGSDIETKPDGSLFKRVTYPKAGYWVAYNRTGGNDPLITITMQKLR